MHTYGVYVIQLAKAAGPRQDRRLPWLYVGQSAKSPEERFAQHKRADDYFYSEAVRDHGLFLRPDLYCDLPRVQGRWEAERMERERADLLAGAGYTVRSNGERAHVAPENRNLFDAERAQAAIDHIDQALFCILAAIGHPISSELLLGLLWNEQSGPVQSLAVEKPSQVYGRFGHVEQSVLDDRLRTLIKCRILQRDGSGRVWFHERARLSPNTSVGEDGQGPPATFGG